MSIEQQVKDLNYKRLKAWDAAQVILTRAQAEGRGVLTAEEQSGYDRAEKEIRKFDEQREKLLSSDAAQAEIETVNSELRRVVHPGVYDSARRNEADELRAFLRGERGRTIDIDLRRASYVSNLYRDGARGEEFRTGVFGDTGASGGSLTIPSLVSSTIYQVMLSSNVMRQTRTTILTTDSGAPLSIPVGSAGAATQIANQDTTYGGTDPTMASKVLRAYDSGQLVAVGNDMIEDAGVDILAWVGNTIAISVGALEEQWWVVGTGSNQPTGLMSSALTGSGGTVATGGSLILGPAGAIGEKFIDVVYSINNVYRQNAEWLMRDSTTAAVRKIRDGAGGTVGAFLFQPSATAGLPGGEPDRLLGFPHYSSSNVAAMGSDAKVLAFGDLSRFVAREVRGFRLERSTDVYFAKNQTAVRGLTRTDSVLTDSTAVVSLHQAVT